MEIIKGDVSYQQGGSGQSALGRKSLPDSSAAGVVEALPRRQRMERAIVMEKAKDLKVRRKIRGQVTQGMELVVSTASLTARTKEISIKT